MSFLNFQYLKNFYINIKAFIYLFFYSIFYPPPKERQDIGSWGGTSYHSFGGNNSGGGGGPSYRGPQGGDNRGSVNRFRNVRRVYGMGG